MAQLSPLIQFTAGTPAVADDVNSNFSAIRNHINSANIDTENIAATLTSRAGGPILFLDQASQNEIVFSIQNSQTNTAMQIFQSAPLAATKAVLKLRDTYAQTAGKAELWLELATGSTIPALLVEHGADVSMSLTKTQLNLFNNVVQATSAGMLSATTVNATTVGATTANLTNANTTGLITATAPVSDAIALKVKGRSSDNNAIVQFKSNDDATVYASATSSSSGLTLNLPDTADSYAFQVNGVTKGTINNSGIDGQYVYNLPVSALPPLTTTNFSWNNTGYIVSAGGTNNYTLVTGTITTTGPGRIILATILDNSVTGGGSVGYKFYTTINGIPSNDTSTNYFRWTSRPFYFAASAGTYSISVSVRIIELGGGGSTSGTILAGSAQFVVLPG